MSCRRPLCVLGCLVVLAAHGCRGAAEPPASTAAADAVADVVTVREGDFAASVAISTPAVAVGEPIGVVLAGEAPQGYDIALPDDAALAPFEIVRAEPIERRLTIGGSSGPAAESLHLQRRLVVATWEPGERSIPDLSFRFSRDGVEPTVLVVPARTVTVASLIEDPFDPAAFDDLRSMPPTPLPRRWWPWALSAALVLLLAGFLLLRGRRAVAPSPPPDPERWAATALAGLAAEGLPARGDVEPFFTRLIDVLRDYLQQRLGLAAPDLTSEEFLRLASADPRFKPPQRASLESLLRFADLVKFARGAATRSECDAAMGEVGAIVEAMRPVAPEVPSASPSPAGGTAR